MGRPKRTDDAVKRRTYAMEEAFLSPYACLSEKTQGRQREETPCNMRTDFQRDRDRIIYSKAFLRLKNKTQVFFSPEGDHFRTRMTHTIDVSQIARSISRSLALNEDLTEAIALGHDLGHTPFGHAGERVLDSLAPQGFRGKTNEPFHVREVYEYVSMLKGVPMEEFAAAVKENVERVFRLEARNVRV